ncbi:MAG TPA: HIT family protein, partial [Propionibacteriaceae bacterium]
MAGQRAARGARQAHAVQHAGARRQQRTQLPTASRRDTNLIPVSDVICQIVSGELDAAVVARDEQVIAFLDHRPVFKGHVLVAPTRHVDTLLSLPSDLM